MSEPTQSEAGAALAWAERNFPLPSPVDIGHERLLLPERSAGGEIQWIETSTRDPEAPPLEVRPGRVRGTQQVYTPTSYVDAVKRYETEDQITYVDQPNSQLVTVLNPSRGVDVDGRRVRVAGDYGDHRVALTLRHTPEYEAWKTGQSLTDQTTFARRMQDGELEITDPAPATMLEIAETFHATSESKFKSGRRLQDGRRSFTFEEDTQASAGENGDVIIPERFKLAMPIYVGGDTYAIECRLQWQYRPQFHIGYTFIRPEVVLDHAFASIVGQVTENIAGLVLSAPVPATR